MVFGVSLYFIPSGEEGPSLEKILFWKICIIEKLLVWVHFCLWTVSSSVKRFPSLSPLQLCKANTMRSSLPTFSLLGKLADAIPGFAEILVVEHSE